MKKSHLLGAVLPLFSILSSVNAANLYLLPGVASEGITGDISADGSVYVGGIQAIRWTAANGIESFLPAIADVQYSYASGISADGTIISGSITKTDGSILPYKWTEQGGLQPLELLFDEPRPLNISGDGSTIVGSTFNASLGRATPTFWTEDGAIHTLPVFETNSGSAYDANHDGSVIVGSARTSSAGLQVRAVRWINGAGPFDLGRLPGSEYYNSDANAVSPDGKYIVGESTGAVNFFEEAFIWTEVDGMSELGQLCAESYCDLSIAEGVSADGAIVVGRAHVDGIHDHAFIWTKDDGMQDLNDYLLGIGVDTQGAVLTIAYGISDDGSTIFGVYFDSSVSGTFIADLSTISPALDIEKLTNGNQADGADDPDVPQIAQGEIVSWTYEVTNTGEVALSEAEIVVTDSQPGVVPALDTGSDAGGDMILSPGETWTYSATAQALDLRTPPAGITVVPGCGDNRNTYENTGRADVVGAAVFDEDLSHYCNFGVADIDIRKQEEGPDTRTLVSGSDVTFEIQVTNTGAIDLIDVIVSDELVPQCNNDIGFLGIGQSVTYDCTVTNVTTSFENEACVAAQSSEGVQVENCDLSNVVIEQPVQVVSVDIKPSKKPDNVIDLKKDKNLKVAIVGDASFNAFNVDPSTVKFGPSEVSPIRFKGQDYNRDGIADLILTFKLADTGIVCGVTTATLTGETYPDPVTAFQGTDSFTIEGCP